MRLNHALRLFTLLAFALFGGALPVAASSDHVVICGADGVKRIVAYDFETGQPVDVEVADPECQDCSGFAPILLTLSGEAQTSAPKGVERFRIAGARMSRRPVGQPSARGPPSLIM